VRTLPQGTGIQIRHPVAFGKRQSADTATGRRKSNRTGCPFWKKARCGHCHRAPEFKYDTLSHLENGRVRTLPQGTGIQIRHPVAFGKRQREDTATRHENSNTTPCRIWKKAECGHCHRPPEIKSDRVSVLENGRVETLPQSTRTQIGQGVRFGKGSVETLPQGTGNQIGQAVRFGKRQRTDTATRLKILRLLLYHFRFNNFREYRCNCPQ